MREIINIHIGQAGIQIGEAIWSTYCHEFGISQSGEISQLQEKPQRIKQQCQISNRVLFNQTRTSQYVPRALFFDSDPLTIESLQKQNKLFNKNNMFKGTGCDTTYYRGFYGNFQSGENSNKKINSILRKQMEKCDCVSGLMLHHSMCGGTGSGLGAKTSSEIKQMKQEFGNINTIDFSVYPSKNMGNEIIEPYNAVLGTSSLLDSSDLIVPINNQKLYEICSKQLDLEAPNFRDLNKCITKIVSNVTLPMCSSDSSRLCTMRDIITNLVPYQRIKMVASSYAPYQPKDYSYTNPLGLKQITEAAFSRDNYILEYDQDKAKSCANHIFYRGVISPFEAVECSQVIKNKFIQTSWVPTGFQLSVFDRSSYDSIPGYNDKEVTVFSNSSALIEIVQNFNHKFDRMYARRAFVHWYCQDSSEGEFSEARQNLAAYLKDIEDGYFLYDQAQYDDE